MYLLKDTDENRALIHRYIEVWEYPDGRIEIHALERVLPYRQNDRLTEVDQGAVVGHKHLDGALELALRLQAERDDRRAAGSPSRAHRGVEVRSPTRLPSKKKQREFTREDVDQMIMELAHEHADARKSAAQNGSKLG